MRAVLIALSDSRYCVNDQLFTSINIRHLCKETRLSRYAVERALLDLEIAEYIRPPRTDLGIRAKVREIVIPMVRTCTLI